MTPTYKEVLSEDVICYDCHNSGGHFTIVNGKDITDDMALARPNLARLYADYICDACFLRRRFEGRL